MALAQASAKIQGLLIEADSLTRDSEKDLVELDGHVQVIKEDQHISCDQARISLRTKRLELMGRVKIVSPKHTIGGDYISLDYETNLGMIYNGFVQAGSVIFEGKILQKIGEDEYYVTDADYTTCTNCPSSWSFAGQTIRAQLGGYAYIKNSLLKMGGVPILPLPYLIVPLKSDRQSGLLTPEFEQSSGGGSTFSQSFFWAINRSEDATISLKNYEKRGLKGLFNYRYALAENSYGEFDTAWIREKDNGALSNFGGPVNTGSAFNRWFLKYSHIYELPQGYTHRVLLNNASDLLYPTDFPLETGNYGDSAMENRVSISKNDDTTHWHVAGDYYINMIRANPLGSNEDSVHRLPEVSFSKSQTLIGRTNAAYSFDLNYVNFARGTKGYDDMTLATIGPDGKTIIPRHPESNQTTPTNPIDCDSIQDCQFTSDGKFDPYKDILRTGQRLEFQPSLYYPIQIMNGLELFPKLSYTETHYQFDAGEERTNIRRYLRTEVAARATMSRVYGNLSDPLSNRILHEIQPEIKYTRIPWIEQKNHPFFGFNTDPDNPFSSREPVSDGDLAGNTGLQFDYNDRIYDSHLVTLGFVNRWVEKYWKANTPVYSQIALLKVSQSYDIYQESKKDPTKDSWSDIATVLNVRLNNFETYSNFNYYPSQKVTNTSARVRMTNDIGQFFQLGLTRNYKFIAGQEVDTKTRTEDYTVAAGFQAPYLNLMGKLVYDGNLGNSGNDRQIKSWAYIAQFKPPGDCWIITMIHDQATAGDTNIRLSMEFSFDGAVRAGLPPETLDKFGF